MVLNTYSVGTLHYFTTEQYSLKKASILCACLNVGAGTDKKKYIVEKKKDQKFCLKVCQTLRKRGRRLLQCRLNQHFLLHKSGHLWKTYYVKKPSYNQYTFPAVKHGGSSIMMVVIFLYRKDSGE